MEDYGPYIPEPNDPNIKNYIADTLAVRLWPQYNKSTRYYDSLNTLIKKTYYNDINTAFTNYIKTLIENNELKYQYFNSKNTGITIDNSFGVDIYYNICVPPFEDDTISPFVFVRCDYLYDKGPLETDDKRVASPLPTDIDIFVKNNKSDKNHHYSIDFRIKPESFATAMIDEDYNHLRKSIEKYNLLPKMQMQGYIFSAKGIQKIIEKGLELGIKLCQREDLAQKD